MGNGSHVTPLSAGGRSAAGFVEATSTDAAGDELTAGERESLLTV
ncbi:MAG: hypothetical protein WCJ42_12670 [Actinomycetes bacterium]